MTDEQIAKLVTDYVNEHKTKLLPKQLEGQAYYKTNNPDIMARRKEYYSSNTRKPVEDPYKSNNRVASSYAKLLVDQKIGYSINDKMSIATEVEGQDKIVQGILRYKTFKKYLRKVAKDACNKYYGALQFYLKGDLLDYKHIPAEQLIRIPNLDENELTDAVIRYYVVDVVEESTGKEIEVTVAEYWDAEYVYYFVKKPDDEKFMLAPVSMYEVNPMYHISTTKEVMGTVVEKTGQGWGTPPFAFLYNNDEMQRDLDPVLPLIKVWDIVMSDFANNLEDFQDVYWILKGYGGQDIDEFLNEVKRYKVLKTDEDGGASTETIEIPTEAREKLLDRLDKLMFKFGRGVNTDDIQGDITNVRIYSLYSGLDLKANEFEMEVNNFFDQVLELTNKYLQLKNKTVINAESIDLSFKRSMILNKAEIVDTLLKQVGFLSKKTLLEQHPDIDDVEEELERLSQEELEQAKLLGGDLDFSDEDEAKKKEDGE